MRARFCAFPEGMLAVFFLVLAEGLVGQPLGARSDGQHIADARLPGLSYPSLLWGLHGEEVRTQKKT
jgi:hypothetical protein